MLITRRDGESLALTKASRADADRSGLELAAHVVAVSLSTDDRTSVERLRDPFPWVALLSAEDQDSFASEVVDVARACATLSRFEGLLISVKAWKDTAEGLAGGSVPDVGLHWFDDDVRVCSPRAGCLRRRRSRFQKSRASCFHAMSMKAGMAHASILIACPLFRFATSRRIFTDS